MVSQTISFSFPSRRSENSIFLSTHLSFGKERENAGKVADSLFLTKSSSDFLPSGSYGSHASILSGSVRSRASAGEGSFQQRYEAARFLSENSRLLEYLGSDDSFQRSLILGTAANSKAVQEEIISGAAEKLKFASPITKDFLRENPDLAKFILLDVGNITDVLNSRDDLTYAITQGGFDGEEMIREQVAQKAAAMFHNKTKITESFLKENTTAAIYLIQNPDVAHELDRSRSKATDFVNTFQVQEDQMQSSVVDEALSLLSGTGVTREFLTNNIDFAEIIVADELVNSSPSLSGYLKGSGALNGIIQRVENGEFSIDSSGINISSLIAEEQAHLASQKLPNGFPLGEDFFQENTSLAFLVNQSEEFLSELSRSDTLVQRFFISGEEGGFLNSRAARTIRDAFILNFAGKGESSSVDIIA
jgi:hypothetical protein